MKKIYKSVPQEDRPLGIRLNNPGNLEHGSPWQGLDTHQEHPRFCRFKEPRWGIRAIAVTLTTYADRRRAKDGSPIDSVIEVIERWAPEKDNNPVLSYVNFVEARVMSAGFDPEFIDLHDYHAMDAVVRAIIEFENGAQYYSDETIAIGLRLAGFEPPPKSVTKSRTVASATVSAGAAGMTALVDSIPSIQKALEPYAEISGVQLALCLLAIAASSYTVWARIDDSLSGKSL